MTPYAFPRGSMGTSHIASKMLERCPTSWGQFILCERAWQLSIRCKKS